MKLKLTLVAVVLAALAFSAPAFAAENTSPPTISGTAQSGQTLVADPGSWTGDTSAGFGYQWQRCDTAGANCSPIAGATQASFVAQEWGITLLVAVSSGGTVARSAATSVVRTPAPYGGRCTLVPNYGDSSSTVFSISCENWFDANQFTPLTYTYQWWACDSGGNCAVESENAPTTTPRGEGLLSGFGGGGVMIGKVVICQFDGSCTTWSDNIYLAGTLLPHLNAFSPPAISGEAIVGETLSADLGEWGGAPTFSYEWYRCVHSTSVVWWETWFVNNDCTPVWDGSTSYTLTAADHGFSFLFEVTATNSEGTTTLNSATTTLVRNAAPQNSVLPAISDANGGALTSGDLLTSDGGSWTGTAIVGIGHQWQRCDAAGANCVPIAGATGSSYTVQPADFGRKIVAAATAANSDGLSSTALSLASANVGGTPPAASAQPQISSSTPLVGTQLSASSGSWTGVPFPGAGDFSYQWQRCGAGCSPIAGATSQSYTPIEADFGFELAVVVSATTSSGSASSELAEAVRSEPVANAQLSLTIESGPAGLSGSASASFGFSSPQQPNVSFHCFLDGTALGTCVSPLSLSDLTEGAHSFSVHASDALGLESSVASDPVWTWTLDTTAPLLNIASGPEASTNATEASFSFAADDPAASFECQLDAGSWGACLSPHGFSGLGLGGHSFQLRASDAAGNVSALVGFGWTVTNPEPTPTPPPTPTSAPEPAPTPTPTPIEAPTVEPGRTVWGELNNPLRQVIASGNLDDVIRTGSGNDVIRSFGGNDTIFNGRGGGFVYAGAGNDVIWAQHGHAVVYCGSGTDKVYANRFVRSVGCETVIVASNNRWVRVKVDRKGFPIIPRGFVRPYFKG